MSFMDYKGTPFARWLLPIIPRGAQLSENSKIAKENVGKIPGVCYPQRGMVWSGYGGWTSHAVSEKILTIYDGWYPKDTWTIGLQSRNFPGLDADVNESWQADVIRDLAFEHFGRTIVRGRDGSPRQLMMYRIKQEGNFIPKFVRLYGEGGWEPFKLEILGKGQQYLIEGPHPEGGRYFWLNGETPLTVGFENIPRIGPEDLPAFIKELDARFAFAGVAPIRPRGLRTGDTGGGPGAVAIGLNHPEVAPNPDELRRVLDFMLDMLLTDCVN